MGRIYSVPIDDVAVSAAQDLIGIVAPSKGGLRLLRVELGQRGLTSWESKPIRIRFFPTTVTNGSGGSSVTPILYGSGNDAAASFTSRINDTTVMSTSGTPKTRASRMWEMTNGFIWVPTPLEEITIAASEGIAINLPTAPSGSTNVSGFALVEERF